MPIQQASFFCPQCRESRLFTRNGVNNLVHILLTLFLCGLWLPVWIIILIASTNNRYFCSRCGYSNVPAVLANPMLTSQRQPTQQRQLTQQYPTPATNNSKSGTSKLDAYITNLLNRFFGFVKNLYGKYPAATIGTGIVIFSIAALGYYQLNSFIEQSKIKTTLKQQTNSTPYPTPIPSSPKTPAQLLAMAKDLLNKPNANEYDRNNAYAYLKFIPEDASEYKEAQELLKKQKASGSDIENPDIKARTAKGEQIYKRISSNYGLPVMFGWQASNIKLLIPIKEWNKLSKQDQVNLTYYAQNLVQIIRQNPKPFVARWSSYYRAGGQVDAGEEYDRLTEEGYLRKASQLCSTCWDISLGTIKGKEFFDEEVPVKGTNVEVFRNEAEKQLSKSFAEKDAEDFKKFAASMPPRQHLIEAEKALDSGYDISKENFGNTELARMHIKAIEPTASEYKEAQKLLQKVIKRENERKEFHQMVVNEMKRLLNVK